MTYQLAIDPGQNSGLALGFYDATTPYRLVERWQVHDGTEGFADWLDEHGFMVPASGLRNVDELVVESFTLANNDFVADITPKQIEGLILGALRWIDDSTARDIPVIWQSRQDKASLIGYPPEADTPDKRQRLRFEFLDRFGFFKPGTENDDSNDAITHALVSLKRRKHAPTLAMLFPPPKAQKLT